MIEPSETYLTRFQGWTLFFCGLCMGAADLIPGISGGTIAFILGFYHPLLESLKTFNLSAFQKLFKGSFRDFFQHIAWKFLLTLFSGILCAFIGLVNVFHFILSHEIYRIYLYSTFFGLILASFVFCLRQIKVWNSRIVIGLFAGVIFAYLLTESTLHPHVDGNYAVPMQIETHQLPIKNYDSAKKLLTGLSMRTLANLLAKGIIQQETPIYNQEGNFIGEAGVLVIPEHYSFVNGWMILCGALAICALLLPGISGCYILTLLGVYPIVIESLVDFIQAVKQFSFDSDAFAILFNLGIGITIGGVVFAKGVSWLLRSYPNCSLAILSGFMGGAIRSVWPFWTYEYVLIPLKIYKGPQLMVDQPFFPILSSPFLWQAFLCGLIGFILLFVLERYSHEKYLLTDQKLKVY